MTFIRMSVAALLLLAGLSTLLITSSGLGFRIESLSDIIGVISIILGCTLLAVR
ncbi:MAG: hypothetical protein OXR66_07665 [Candidatus Woesearchaeota archaeon]|nr:hypothetical protein [Candidatus Woesearchaeota archaeon]